MKRWAVCKMREVAPSEWEPAIAAHDCAWRIIHLGLPVWVLCQFAATSITAISNDVNIKILPDLTYDTTWGTLNSAARNKAINELQGAGFTTTGIKTTSTIREVLNYIGQQIDPNFNCEAGDVKEPA